MAYVFFALAAFLLLVAWFHREPRERGMAAWFLFWALVNCYCGWHMIDRDEPYARELRPDDGQGDHDYNAMPDRR